MHLPVIPVCPPCSGSLSYRGRLSFSLLSTACLMSTLMLSRIGSAAEPEQRSEVSVDSLVDSQKLRLDARLSAENGDFLQAARHLKAAATRTGDAVLAARISSAEASIQAAGGAQGADFSSLMTLIQEQTTPPARWYDTDGEGGRMTPFPQGIYIGGPAALSTVLLSLDNSRLMQAAELARTSNQNSDVHAASELRLVSLSRLELEVRRMLAEGTKVSDDAAVLAGLTEIRYLFRFPETGELVLGGPAGDWKTAEDGRTVGTVTERPTLRLDDLVTLSRTFSSGGSGFFMCSIDPRQGQVKALNDYLQSNRSRLTAATADEWTKNLEQTLGMQNVVVQGIPFNSRVASVIVDADYRMKEIGVGRREGVSGMKNYFDILTRSERKGQGSMEALRWWMTVRYGAVQVAADRNSFELTGRSIQCLSENQMVNADGQRSSTGRSDRANSEFASLFTEHLPELAERDPVFADLENVFDLALVSALIHSGKMAAASGLNESTFAPGGDYGPAATEVPRELMTAAECRVYKGGDVVIQVAGGVRGDIRSIINNPGTFVEAPELSEIAADADPTGIPAGHWWWDARK